ncbi:MAG TPA: hypothetical protein PLS23_16805, partial [Phycisphaerae bacterium]|nr:hypothetical protein [Phycisphaerae bacterium]
DWRSGTEQRQPPKIVGGDQCGILGESICEEDEYVELPGRMSQDGSLGPASANRRFIRPEWGMSQ